MTQDAILTALIKRAGLAEKRANDFIRMRPGTPATGIVSDLRDMVEELRKALSHQQEQPK